MDVVPDRGLIDFIDGLDVKGRDTSLNTNVCEKEEETDVWQDIPDALNNLTQRILDTEGRRATSENYRETIEESLTLRFRKTPLCAFRKPERRFDAHTENPKDAFMRIRKTRKTP